MKPVDAHRREGVRAVRVAIVTVSDTRTQGDDASGALAIELLEAGGHEVVAREIVKDEPLEVRACVERLTSIAEVVVTNGGTGIAARDSTYEALASRFDKTLDGFGELFRALSYVDVGTAAMMSRATAGTLKGAVIVMLPGSPDAVRLGLEKIVIPELGHLAKLTRSSRATAHGATSSSTLTHLDTRGHAHMVDVGAKAVTTREAIAQAIVTMSAECFALLSSGATKKGDVLATARIAGIQASKKTSELIPLCHPIALSSVSVELELDEARHAVRVIATTRTTDRTGVEMEALVAANVAALTVYDMLKAVDRAITIGEVALLKKTGGKSGDYTRGG